MAEVLFDTVIGEVVLAAQSDSSVPESKGLVPLGELLDAPVIPYVLGDFEKENAETWDREKCIDAGKLALKALEKQGVPQPLKSRHMARLAILGIVPYQHVYEPHFGNFSAYKSAIGSPFRYDRVTYKNWSTREFVTYAKQTRERLGRLPLLQDYIKQSNQREGPSFKLIQNRVGGIKSLHDKLGYPDTHAWAEDDFIAWGIRVMKANPDKKVNLYMVEILSNRGRGPSIWTLYDRCDDGWAALKQKINADGKVQIEAEAAARTTNLAAYEVLLNSGTLPARVAAQTDQEKLSVHGRYSVVHDLTRDVSKYQLAKLLTCHPDQFITQLRKIKPSLSAAIIEIAAESAQVFDDIWPAEASDEYLHVESHEIDALRMLRSAQKRRYDPSTKRAAS